MLLHTSRSGLGGSGLLSPLRGWERWLALFLGLTPQALRCRPFGAEFIAGSQVSSCPAMRLSTCLASGDSGTQRAPFLREVL